MERDFEAKSCFRDSANKQAKDAAALYGEEEWEGGVPGEQRAA